jgi:hypothetical protein
MSPHYKKGYVARESGFVRNRGKKQPHGFGRLGRPAKGVGGLDRQKSVQSQERSPARVTCRKVTTAGMPIRMNPTPNKASRANLVRGCRML